MSTTSHLATLPAPYDRQTTILRPVVEADRAALSSFVSGLSPRSSWQRFFTGGFRATTTALDTLLALTTGGRAYVAVEGQRIVGHAMWASFPNRPHEVDIAFVVADDRRRRGLGSGLARLAINDAVASGAREIHATVMASNRGAQSLVRQVLPHAHSEYDDGDICYLARVDEDPCADLRAVA
jgi:RimJ/RimL family protein N-acetyltransferase